MPKLTGTRAGLRVAACRVVTLVACAALAAACGTSGQEPSGSGKAQSGGSSKASVNDELRAMLPAKIRDAGTMSVAISATFPPYGFVTADGSFTGISYDLGQAVAALLGVTFKYENAKQALATTGLQGGKYDLAITVIVDGADAEKAVTVVDWLKRNSRLLVPKDNPKNIKDIEQFCDGSIKIAIVNSSSQAPFIRDQDSKCKAAGKKGINVAYFDNSNATVLALSSGRADAVLLDTLAGGYAAQKNPALTRVGPAYLSGLYGWGVNKDNAEMTKVIQAALQKLMDDGTYKTIVDKYQAADNAVDKVVVNASATS